MKGLPTDNVLLSDDNDGDGLTLGQEYEYDTNPFSADTDEDGLEDYSEINIYHTDPNKWDTDGDGMSDGTEVNSGLNPLIADTDGDGIPDSEEVITQDVRIESVNKFDIKETLVKPKVEITGKGDFSNQLYAEDINNNKALSELDYMVGHPFDFVHEEGLVFESSKSTFSIDESIMQDNKLEDLVIAGYDTKSNEVQILDTDHDTDNNSIWANVNHYSIYFVLNLNAYLDTVLSENTVGMKDGKADIDTSFYMSAAMDNIKANLQQFIDELGDNNVDTRLGLVEFGGFYISIPEQIRDYNWYPDVDSCKSAVSSLKAHGIYDDYDAIGFDDAIKNIKNMDFRPDASKYVIMITDTEIILSSMNQKTYELPTEKEFLSLTASDNLSEQSDDSTILLNTEIPIQPSDGICFSAITQFAGYSPYESLVYETNGVNSNVRSNFANTLNSLIYGTGGSESGGCYVKLSNGFTVRLDKDPSLGDESVDTDDDGIPDVDDLNSSVFDTVILENTDDLIRFNTGRTWRNITCNSFDYLDNLFGFIDNVVDNPIPLEEFRIIVDNNSKNRGQNFNIDELAVIGLINNEGSKLYMNDKSSYTRETVFTILAGRESKDFKHSGILWWSDWKVVPKGTEGGFFKGTILSEADINFSTELYYVCDVYTVLDTVAAAGAIVIAIVIAAEVTPVVLANIQGIIYYCKTFGVVEGLKMYQYLGVCNLPNSVITWVQWDIADGDSSLDDLIGSNIPIYQRGESGEQALEKLYGGKSQVYFRTYVNGIKGGRYVDQYADGIAHEAKVGYTCLSSRVKIQILKDAWLLENNRVDEVIWHFFKSDITGKVGASPSLLEFLETNGIEYIIH
ncbi:MAG: hypothetical protein WCD89_18780 [Anaerocolumna sp.]